MIIEVVRVLAGVAEVFSGIVRLMTRLDNVAAYLEILTALVSQPAKILGQ